MRACLLELLVECHLLDRERERRRRVLAPPVLPLDELVLRQLRLLGEPPLVDDSEVGVLDVRVVAHPLDEEGRLLLQLLQGGVDHVLPVLGGVKGGVKEA